MPKFRSNLNFATQYLSKKQGYAIGIENFVFIREETTPGVFNPPQIGTQGKSTSGTTPSTDLSAGTDVNLRVAVDGGAVVTATLLSVATLSTATLIAAALETAINLALNVASQDARVWVEFAAGKYVVWSQKADSTSLVVITNGLTLNVADDLKLGLANTGAEVVGLRGTDFVCATKSSLKRSQPFEKSKCRSGRQALDIIKKKIVAEGDLEMYVSMNTASATPEIDLAVATLLEQIFGKKTVTASEIKFDSSQPQTKYFSVVQGNNIFSRVLNGGYAKSWTLTLPGDGEAMVKFGLKGQEVKEASVVSVPTVVLNSVNVVATVGESDKADVGAVVMVVDADGRTVLFGATGTLTIVSRNDTTNTIVLSSPVSIPAGGFLTGWMPHVFGFSEVGSPVTGLEGSVSFDGGATTIEEIRSVELMFDPKVEDLDGYYGADGNRGYVVGDRSDIKAKVEMNLSASQYDLIVQAKAFTSFAMKFVLGPVGGRRLEVIMPKVIYTSPAVELPDTEIGRAHV